MKILLTLFVYYMDPATRSINFLWQEEIPQKSTEQCSVSGEKYKYALEINEHVEVQYFCNDKKVITPIKGSVAEPG